MSNDWINDLNDISGIKPKDTPNDLADINIGTIGVTEGNEIGRIPTDYTKDNE